MDGVLTNRVSLSNAVTVQSVNGPLVTTVQGAGPVGPNAVRCAWLTNSASLVGFTLRWGATRSTGGLISAAGGGAWCASSNCLIANCMIVSNSAANDGGAAYRGAFDNCLLASSSVFMGGSAAVSCILRNCTIVSNSCSGVNSSTVTNCVVYFNTQRNVRLPGSVYFCCVTPLPSGAGNFTNDPQLFADSAHLMPGSPCIQTGASVASGSDLFGQPWSDPPSIGCAEWQPSPFILPPQILFTAMPSGFSVASVVDGQQPIDVGWLKDGAPLQDDGHFAGTHSCAMTANSVSFADVGAYQLVASNAYGVATSAVARLQIHSVDAACPNPVPPYTNWPTAATNIQDAIDAATDGDVILVTNGVYAAGGRVMDGDLVTRVALNKAVKVQSVNGPFLTAIRGSGPVGQSAVRCAWLTNNAALVGFTMCGGATRGSGAAATAQSGAGVWCISSNSLVASCMIVSNVAYDAGGGIFNGNAQNSLIFSNNAYSGGGAYESVLVNCTIVSNAGGAVYLPAIGAATNCIIDYNLGNTVLVFASHCCTFSVPTGVGNITNAPQLFIDGLHLTAASHCIGAGIPVGAGTDLFGQPWANPPSIGCVEWQPAPVVLTPKIQLTNVPGFSVGNVPINGQPPLSLSGLINKYTNVLLLRFWGRNDTGRACRDTALITSYCPPRKSGNYPGGPPNIRYRILKSPAPE